MPPSKKKKMIVTGSPMKESRDRQFRMRIIWRTSGEYDSYGELRHPRHAIRDKQRIDVTALQSSLTSDLLHLEQRNERHQRHRNRRN